MDSTTPLPLAAPHPGAVHQGLSATSLSTVSYVERRDIANAVWGASPCVMASKSSLAWKTRSGGRGAASVCSQQENTPVRGAGTCRQGSIAFRLAGFASKHRFSPAGRCVRSADLTHLL